ncbi:MAG: sugar phosphate isomerase/epimerase [Pseudomonadota bacterium]
MEILLSTGSLFKYPLEEIFEISAKAGFDGVELIWGKSLKSVNEIKKISHKFNQPVKIIHEPFYFWDIDSWPNHPGERIYKTLEIAKEFDVSTVVIHVGVACEVIKWQKENIPKIQAETSIKLAVENMPEVYPFLGMFPIFNNSYKKYFSKVDSLKTIKAFKNYLLRSKEINYSLNKPENITFFDHLTFDTTHVATTGHDILVYYEKLKDKIIHLHVSDFFKKEHRFPGKGSQPLSCLIRRLKNDNYSGAITLEVFPESFTDYKDKKSTLSELSSFVRGVRDDS